MFCLFRCCTAQSLSLTSHISSNGHVHNLDSTELTGVHEIESHTPMLTRLSENENSDAKVRHFICYINAVDKHCLFYVFQTVLLLTFAFCTGLA